MKRSHSSLGNHSTATTILLLAISATMFAETNQKTKNKAMDHVKHLTDFHVIEFRRYTIKEGEREHFAAYFESYFPEAFQQLGAIAFGEFFERNRSSFTWFRGFHNLDARGTVNAAFYY